jgi:uncharacterized protein
MLIERRVTLSDFEIRESDGGVLFVGHAAVFNSPTDLGPFREQVAPGAFKRTIGPGRADVRLLFNHEADSVMARTTNGTLRLREDHFGLLAEADLDPSDWDVQRLLPKLRSGNVSQMSFGFRAIGESDDWWDRQPEDGGKPIRTLREVQLFDVSAVTFPAYDDTDAALNSMARGALAVAELRGLACDLSDVVDAFRDACHTAPPDEVEEPTQEPMQEETREETPEEAPPPAEEPRPAPSRLELAHKRLAYLKTTL